MLFSLSSFHPFTPSNFLLALILILAAVLRFYALDSSSLWSDEGNSWALIQRSFAQIASDAAADIHPPGYYWLLKIWSLAFGVSAFAMRSFSVLCGVILVWVIYQIGIQLSYAFIAPSLSQSAFRFSQFAILASLLAAVNPFQIYYSQEARMYVLLALESAGLMWALLAMGKTGRGGEAERGRQGALALYVVCAVAGLWTHYSFPIVLVAGGIYWVARHGLALYATRLSQAERTKWVGLWREFVIFLRLNLLVLLLFSPWMSIAIDRVRNWPQPEATTTNVQALQAIAQSFLQGPIVIPSLTTLPTTLSPTTLSPTTLSPTTLSPTTLPTVFVILAWIVPLIGLWRWRTNQRVWAIALWLFLPIVLMFAAGLFRDAYLKFLLVASPAWCLLSAAAVAVNYSTVNYSQNKSTTVIHYALRTTHYALLAILILTAYPALRTYYANPAARDNYQGVAAYIAALGNPQSDLVLLDAPGQADVWRYYDPGVPFLTLPQQRPPDEAQTLATLQNAARDRQHIFALFWATDEADPNAIVEHWLDANAFKGLDQWQGNLRFVTYALSSALNCQPFVPAPHFGAAIQLNELCQPQTAQSAHAGSPALIGLRWQTSLRLATRYKVSLQLLDQRNQLIAQRDSEPGGDSSPTIDWLPNKSVVDNHGLIIPIGTPPGNYRMIVALYDAETGQRLPVGSGDFYELGSVTVLRPLHPIPTEIVPMQQRVNHAFANGVTLLGYDLYERGFAHDPQRKIDRGATVHLTFYWQAPAFLPANWRADQQFVLQLGEQRIDSALAGGLYPTGDWQPGELVRGEVDIQFDGSNRYPILMFADDSLHLVTLP